MSFETTVKDWILVDKEMRELNAKMHELRAKRNELDAQIITHSENRNAKTFKYGDVKMRVVNTNTAESLTFKYLEKCLSDMVKNETQVKQMIEYIKQTRSIKQSTHVERI
jgi:seryl-tRNA synthetase